MSRKLGLLLVVFLVIVPLVMTACGGNDKKDNAKAADLKQEFKSTTGITVKYPDGWAAQDGDSGVEIANKAEYLNLTGNTEIPAGAVAVLIMAAVRSQRDGAGGGRIGERCRQYHRPEHGGREQRHQGGRRERR